MTERSLIGKIGEDSATRYIQQYRKWKILGRNVRLKVGEIDIVAQENETIIFVEVKSGEVNARAVEDELRPEQHLDFRKEQKLKAVCGEYLIHNKYPENTDWRVDLAAVLVDYDNRLATVRYFQNVVSE